MRLSGTQHPAPAPATCAAPQRSGVRGNAAPPRVSHTSPLSCTAGTPGTRVLLGVSPADRDDFLATQGHRREGGLVVCSVGRAWKAVLWPKPSCSQKCEPTGCWLGRVANGPGPRPEAEAADVARGKLGSQRYINFFPSRRKAGRRVVVKADGLRWAQGHPTQQPAPGRGCGSDGRYWDRPP
jgi:hypothetical protein